MSLLFHNTNEKVSQISRAVFNKHFELDPKLNDEYDDRRKALLYEDILYNMSYLETAMEFDDDLIFINYSIWIYQLLCNIMKDLSKERLKDHMVLHYEILKSCLEEILSDEEFKKATHHIDNAISATISESVNSDSENRFETGEFLDIKKEYLESLLRSDSKNAVSIIQKAMNSGIDIDTIYHDILMEVMYEVGNLWHKNIITVDKEHYCTSTTQVALSQFYPIIFSRPRNGHKIVTCCVGSELHEMGIRMLSDLFEYYGWDSIYLGAAVPTSALLHSIEENKPDIVALSVTMPQHLTICRSLVKAIKENYSDIKIAVGGRAFQLTDDIWKKWDVDISTDNASELVKWANENIVEKGSKKA